MRVLDAKDIFPKLYSIVNGEIKKVENGDYYTKQAAEYVLTKNTNISESEKEKIIKLDEEQLNKNAVKYFKNMYSMLLSLNLNNLDLLLRPSKIYEIFILDCLGGKACLALADNLPNGQNRDLYYDFEIARDVYFKTIDIYDSSFNDYKETLYIYSREILQTENEIEDLKKRDNKYFEKDINIYDLICDTPIYYNYQLLNKDKEKLIKENENLNKKVLEYNDKINDLNQELNVSLDKIKHLQKPKTFFEKLKGLFRSDKKQLLITDGKGEE